MAGPQPFPAPADLRGWFTEHGETEPELWVVFFKAHTGKPNRHVLSGS